MTSNPQADTGSQPTTELPEVPERLDERGTLTTFLDYYRTVLRRKAEGLTDAQLQERLTGHRSTLTLAGLLHHLASVEDWWFRAVMLGEEVPEPWRSGWERSDNWDFEAATELGAADVLERFDRSVASSREVLAGLGELDQPSVRAMPDGQSWSLRWVLVHLVEEYARHAGHADLLREQVDRVSGD